MKQDHLAMESKIEAMEQKLMEAEKEKLMEATTQEEPMESSATNATEALI